MIALIATVVVCVYYGILRLYPEMQEVTVNCDLKEDLTKGTKIKY